MPGERQALQHLFELVEAGIPPSAETMAQCRAALEPERFTDATYGHVLFALWHGDRRPTEPEQVLQMALMKIANACMDDRRLRLKLPNSRHLIIELEK